VLEWAAGHQRILLTHDVATITAFAHERVRTGKPMPGVFEVPRTVAVRSAIDDIVLLATSSEAEFAGQPVGRLAVFATARIRGSYPRLYISRLAVFATARITGAYPRLYIICIMRNRPWGPIGGRPAPPFSGGVVS